MMHFVSVSMRLSRWHASQTTEQNVCLRNWTPLHMIMDCHILIIRKRGLNSWLKIIVLYRPCHPTKVSTILFLLREREDPDRRDWNPLWRRFVKGETLRVLKIKTVGLKWYVQLMKFNNSKFEFNFFLQYDHNFFYFLLSFIGMHFGYGFNLIYGFILSCIII